MEIIIASSNLHKIRELRAMLKPFEKRFDVLSLLNFTHYSPPSEEGASFKENASQKAKHAAQALQKWVLADDSGLVVPALKGAPGLLSKQFANEEATDSENRKKLLDEMKDLKNLQRSAYYECCLVLADPAGTIKKTVSGTCEGVIIHEERGRNGFGYDPIFVKNEYDKTFAEIAESTKNRVSHRCKAFEKLTATLETLC